MHAYIANKKKQSSQLYEFKAKQNCCLFTFLSSNAGAKLDKHASDEVIVVKERCFAGALYQLGGREED